MIADELTKALAKDVFERLKRQVGLIDRLKKNAGKKATRSAIRTTVDQIKFYYLGMIVG
jgi:hypothetical protein